MMNWPLDMIAQGGYLGDLGECPKVKAWRELVQARPDVESELREGE